MLTLYENIKKRREELGMTKVRLAELVGYERSMITKIEQGKVDLTQSKIAAIAKALQTTTIKLMGEDSIPEEINNLPHDAIPHIPVPMARVPLVGSVNCGSPIFAEDNIEGYIETPIEEMQSGETYFWLRAKGDSMVNVGIHDGDLLFIRQQSDVDSGDIAVVAINGDDATLKRVIKKENSLVLQPENPAYETKIYVGSEVDNICIRGRLMKVEKRF